MEIVWLILKILAGIGVAIVFVWAFDATFTPIYDALEDIKKIRKSLEDKEAPNE